MTTPPNDNQGPASDEQQFMDSISDDGEQPKVKNPLTDPVEAYKEDREFLDSIRPKSIIKPVDARSAPTELSEVDTQACQTCGQSDTGQTGEYPCRDCGLPRLHDDAPTVERCKEGDVLAEGATPTAAAGQRAPDGWKLVPVQPTEDMIVFGFESAPDEYFSEPDEWEAYQALSGCQQAAHRAKLCWDAMLAAAPTPPAVEGHEPVPKCGRCGNFGHTGAKCGGRTNHPGPLYDRPAPQAAQPAASVESSLHALADEVIIASNTGNLDLLTEKTQGLVRAVKALPVAAQAQRMIFPTMLRKMWNGAEVQAWLDEQLRVETPKPSAKGSLERYRAHQATQPAQDEREAVEIVGYRVSLPSEPELGHWFDEEAESEPWTQKHEPLMTVAQHERIVAALSTPRMEGLNLHHYGDVLRPFVQMMADELLSNRGKGDRPVWTATHAEALMLEIYYHAAKLQKAIKDGAGDGIREYAADVANLCMMVLDVCGGVDAAIAAMGKGGEHD